MERRQPDLVIRIDPAVPDPVFRQIADAIRTLMVEGRLRPGDRLPPVRTLAVDLMVHHNTVALAYRELAAEGWLDARRGRGVVVLERATPRPASGATDRYKKRLRDLLAKAKAEGVDPKSIQRILADIIDT